VREISPRNKVREMRIKVLLLKESIEMEREKKSLQLNTGF
jgi:hypothetical protein